MGATKLQKTVEEVVHLYLLSSKSVYSQMRRCMHRYNGSLRQSRNMTECAQMIRKTEKRHESSDLAVRETWNIIRVFSPERSK